MGFLFNIIFYRIEGMRYGGILHYSVQETLSTASKTELGLKAKLYVKAYFGKVNPLNVFAIVVIL